MLLIALLFGSPEKGISYSPVKSLRVLQKTKQNKNTVTFSRLLSFQMEQEIVIQVLISNPFQSSVDDSTIMAPRLWPSGPAP